MILSLILAALAAQAPASADAATLARVRQAVADSENAADCKTIRIPPAALAAARFSGGAEAEVVVDYDRVVCPGAPMQWTGSAGTVIEVWASDDDGAPRVVFAENVYGWRIEGGALATDENGTRCGGRNADPCRVIYSWDRETRRMRFAIAHYSGLTLQEEAAPRYRALKTRVRAAVIKVNAGCAGISVPASALRPIGDVTGDGRPEMVVDYGQVSCRGEGARRWFSTGGYYTQVWSEDGGRLRPLFADNADWATSRAGRLVTEEHADRCKAPGGSQYCEVTRRYDRRKGRLVVSGHVLKTASSGEDDTVS